jgi:two-component system sensor kinase FixL
MIRVLYLNGSFEDHDFVVEALTAEGGFQVTRTTERLDLQQRLARGECDLVLSDIEVLGFAPLAFIDFVRAASAVPPVVILTANESVDVAVEAMKRGAADYILATSDNARHLPEKMRSALDRTRREEKLRESQQWFRSIFEHSPEILVLVDMQGVVVEVNGKASELLGYERAHLVGNRFENLPLWSKETKATLRDMFARCLGGETIAPYEIEFLCSDGRAITCQMHGTTLKNHAVEITHVLLMVSDVTRRRAAEEALRTSETRFRAVSELVSDYAYAFRVEQDGTLTAEWVTDALVNVTGYTANELKSLGGWERLIHPDDLTIAEGQLTRLLSGEAYTVEYRIVTKSGEQRWTRDYARPEWDEREQRVVRIYGAGQDITDRKRAKEAMRASDTRFRALIEQSPFGISLYNPDGTVRYGNEALRRMYGISREVQARLIANYNILQDDQLMATGVASGLKRAFEGEPTALPTVKYDTRKSSVPSHDVDGEFWIESFAYPIKGGDGNFEEVVVVQRDVTEQKRAETALKESEERFRALFENALDGILLADVETKRLLSPNPSMCQMLGYRREEIEQLHVFDIHPHKDIRHVVAIFEKQAHEKIGLAESVPMKRKDGSVFYADINSSPITLAGKRYLLGFFRDITERKRSEERLRAMESQLAHVTRLSTMGELVAGIAHEVNQPLYSIENFAKAIENVLAADCGRESEQLRDWNAEIAAASDRAGRIMKRLRGFARTTDSQRSTADLKDIVSETIELMAFESRQRRVVVRPQPCDEDTRAQVDRVQIQQVLVNLLQNAFEALDSNDPGDRQVVVETRVSEGSICVSVADNGPGLPPEGGLNLFDAFATTKRHGLGMGLAISRTIVEAHGGRLLATFNAQGGATFHFTLPTARRAENDGAWTDGFRG